MLFDRFVFRSNNIFIRNVTSLWAEFNFIRGIWMYLFLIFERIEFKHDPHLQQLAFSSFRSSIEMLLATAHNSDIETSTDALHSVCCWIETCK